MLVVLQWVKVSSTETQMSPMRLIGLGRSVQVNRITLRNTVTGDENIVTLSKEQEANEAHYKDKETGAELEVIEKMPLLEWLANSYKKFGCQLEFVTNKSQVG